MNFIHNRSGNHLFNTKNELYSFLMAEAEPSPAQKKKSSAILDAARAHFAAHGFEATKLSDVARDAGVAVGTIYLRYQGKAELLAGVLDAVEQSFCDAMDTPSIWQTRFPERFTHVIAAVLATAQKQEHLAALMALSAFASKATSTEASRMLTKIEAHIRDGIARGELRDDRDVALVARMAHGMVEGAMRDLMSNPNRNPEEIIAHVSDAYQRWLGKP